MTIYKQQKEGRIPKWYVATCIWLIHRDAKNQSHEISYDGNNVKIGSKEFITAVRNGKNPAGEDDAFFCALDSNRILKFLTWLLLPLFRIFVKSKKATSTPESLKLVDTLKRNQFVDHGEFWRKGFVKIVLEGNGGYAQTQYTGHGNGKIKFSGNEDLDGILVYMKRWF